MMQNKIRFSLFGLFFVSVLFIATDGSSVESKQSVLIKEPSIKACGYIAAKANEGKLNQVLLKSQSLDPPAIKVPVDLPGSDVVFARTMDINNDGVLERVFVESQGTAHYEDFSVFKLKKDEAIEFKETWGGDWSDDTERWAADRAFFEYQGVTYVLGKSDQSLQYLLYINPNNEIKVVCEFGQREELIECVRKNHNDNVCKQASNDELNYVEFDKLHSLSDNEIRKAGFREAHAADKAALVDIDNDGRKEIVVSLKLASGAGRGCDAGFLAVLTADRTAIDRRYDDKLPSSRCGGTTVKPFIVNGKIYLDERQDGLHAEHRQIYMLDRSKLKTICEFDIRPDNYVMSPAASIEKSAGSEENLWEYAMSQPGTEAVDILIKEGRHLNKRLKVRGNAAHSTEEAVDIGMGPIEAALWHKREDILEKLLRAGADPNYTSQQYQSNIGFAVKEGTLKSLSLLLKYGAKDTKDYTVSAREAAIEGKDLGKLETLLKGGVPIDCDCTLDLIERHDSQKHEKLKLLVKYGLDSSMLCTKSFPIKGITQTAPGVLSIGPEFKFKEVKRPLIEWAKASGDSEVLKLLVNARAGAPDIETYLTLRQADENLSDAYRLLSGSLDKSGKAALRKEQRKWLGMRNQQCGLHAAGSSSMDKWLKTVAANAHRAKCVYIETTKRTDKLAARLMPFAVSPEEGVTGRSLTEWMKEFWHWSKSFPEAEQPFKDRDGSRCSQKQAGPVWFLVGSDNGKSVIRNCEVPSGKYILIPVLISLAEDESNQPKQCPRMKNILENLANGVRDVPATEAKREKIPDFAISLISMMEGKLTLQKDPINYTDIAVEVDSLKVPRHFLKYQVTDCFTLNKRGENIQAVGDGYWLILKPLTPGKHTIRFGGMTLRDGFSQNVQYNLNVK